MMRPWSLALMFALTSSCMYEATAQEPGVATIRSRARLVIVDVTVTDKQGHPVHDLKQSDFTVLEGRQPQTIRSFEEHTAAAAAAQPKPMPKLPPGVFTNDTPLPASGAADVLLLDTLNTPAQDQSLVRQQLLTYLEKQRPGANVAIFGLTTHLLLLQDFNSDPEVLRRALLPRKSVGASPLLRSSVSGANTAMQLSDVMNGTPDANRQSVARAMEFETLQASGSTEQRIRLTLDAMNQLARYLGGIPGRKNVIWFSGSFPITIRADSTLLGTGANPFAGTSSAVEEFRQTVDLFSRGQVAVYPVYAHGMTAPAMFNPELGGTNRNMAASGPNEQDKAFSQTASDRSTMDLLANETGGRTYDLSGAVEKAFDNGANYYTLAYAPGEVHRKGEYLSIKVSLQQKGYTLGYRKGYMADDPAGTPRVAGASAASRAMQVAMTFAAPPASQILFQLRALPTSNTAAAQVAPGNRVMADSAKTGPYRSYTLDYLADANGIEFEAVPEEKHEGELEYVVCVYDPGGKLIDVASSHVKAGLTSAQYAALLEQGLHFQMVVSVPAKGEYLLRVGIHDLKSDRIGSLELPVAAIANLPPLAASDAKP